MTLISRFFGRDLSIDPQNQSPIGALSTDMRFQILGPNANALERTCKLLWGDRHVRLQNNATELSRFLSSCLCYYWPHEVNQVVQGFSKTNTPIKLEVFAGTKKASIDKIFNTFSCVDMLAIVPEPSKEVSWVDRLHTLSSQWGCYGLYYSLLPSSLDGCQLKPTALQIYPKDSVLADVFNKSVFSSNLKKFIFTRKVYEDNPEKYQSLDWKQRRAIKADELSFIFQSCPNLEELTLSYYEKECLQVAFPSTLKHLSLGSSNLFGVFISESQLDTICRQCPQLESLDIMRSIKSGPVVPGNYNAIQSLPNLKKFTISRVPTYELLTLLLQCPLQCLELHFFNQVFVRWLTEQAKLLLLKIQEIIIDINKNDEFQEEGINLLQKTYPHLEIKKNLVSREHEHVA